MMPYLLIFSCPWLFSKTPLCINLIIWTSKSVIGSAWMEAASLNILQTYTCRDATRLDCARGKKYVCRIHVWTWGLSEANLLCWRKYLWHCWNFSAPPAVIRRSHSDSAPRDLCPLVAPLHTCPKWCNAFLTEQQAYIGSAKTQTFTISTALLQTLAGSRSAKHYSLLHSYAVTILLVQTKKINKALCASRINLWQELSTSCLL